MDPYRMVATNLIASCILLIGILFYIYVYPKKRINLFLLLILVSILPLISILRPGDYESGDFNIHIYRIIDFYNSINEGTLLPSWAGQLNATYGYPLFIFNYPLPYYIVSFFHSTGITFITSMKIYLGLNLFLSGIFMYLWIKELTKNELAAFTSSTFYLFSPYHLIDIHFRATVGESTIFTLAPLLFYFITKYVKEKKIIFLALTSFFTGLLFLAHALLAGVLVGIAILYTLLLTIKKGKKIFIFSILSLLSGTIISIYAWIPFLIYSP